MAPRSTLRNTLQSSVGSLCLAAEPDDEQALRRNRCRRGGRREWSSGSSWWSSGSSWSSWWSSGIVVVVVVVGIVVVVVGRRGRRPRSSRALSRGCRRGLGYSRANQIRRYGLDRRPRRVTVVVDALYRGIRSRRSRREAPRSPVQSTVESNALLAKAGKTTVGLVRSPTAWRTPKTAPATTRMPMVPHIASRLSFSGVMYVPTSLATGHPTALSNSALTPSLVRRRRPVRTPPQLTAPTCSAPTTVRRHAFDHCPQLRRRLAPQSGLRARASPDRILARDASRPGACRGDP